MSVCPWCEAAGETCVYCLKGRLKRAEKERDAARELAREYRHDLQQLVTDYQWSKHYAHDGLEYPWLEGVDTSEPTAAEIAHARRLEAEER